MQNKKTRQSLILVLVLALVAMTFIGCKEASSTTETPSTVTATEAKESVETTEPETTEAVKEAAGPYGKFDEPVTITYLSTDLNVSMEYDSSNPQRKSATENMWIDGYLEYLNIDLERIIAEDDTALNAIINTSMASGDLPDIVYVDREMFYVMAENGVCANLEEPYNAYSESYGTLLKEAVSTQPSAVTAAIYEGELLAFPRIGKSYTSTEGLWVRQDWLNTAGMSTPSTIDELVELARTLKDSQLGGENTIGLGITDVEDCVMAAYGVIMNTWQQTDDGTYVYANTMDEMKDGLLQLQAMYNEGLIKSDFAVSNILDEEVANGAVGLFYGPAWNAVTNIKSNLLNDENAEWVCCTIPSLDGNDVKQYGAFGPPTMYYVVNKECEHPEALFMLIEMGLHMYYEPTPEERAIYYVTDDGYYSWSLMATRDFTRADHSFVVTKLVEDALKNNLAVEDVDPNAQSAYASALEGFNGNREKWGYYLYYTIGFPTVIEQYEKGLLVGGYMGPLTENMTLYQSTIDEALTNAMLEVIMGADISVFEDAVETWYKTGGQDITDEVNEYYKSLG